MSKLLDVYHASAPFATYYRRASEKEELARAVAQELKFLIQPKWSMIDIGCNDGGFAVDLLRQAPDAAVDLASYHGIDPCAAALQRFRHEEMPPYVPVTLENTGLEHYAPAIVGAPRSGRPFTVALASHCLYWVPSLSDAVGRILNLADNVVIVARGPEGVYSFQDHFRASVPRLKNNRFNVTHIQRILDTRGLLCSRVDFKTTVQLRDLAPREAARLVAFLLDSPLDELPEETLRTAARKLKSYGDAMMQEVSLLVVRSPRPA